jgi:hypothetical protein
VLCAVLLPVTPWRRRTPSYHRQAGGPRERVLVTEAGPGEGHGDGLLAVVVIAAPGGGRVSGDERVRGGYTNITIYMKKSVYLLFGIIW